MMSSLSRGGVSAPSVPPNLKACVSPVAAPVHQPQTTSTPALCLQLLLVQIVQLLTHNPCQCTPSCRLGSPGSNTPMQSIWEAIVASEAARYKPLDAQQKQPPRILNTSAEAMGVGTEASVQGTMQTVVCDRRVGQCVTVVLDSVAQPLPSAACTRNPSAADAVHARFAQYKNPSAVDALHACFAPPKN
eukprot:360381-Chlamydomonas_euryale.AAC.4